MSLTWKYPQSLFLTFCCLSVWGCSFAPDYSRPDLGLPGEFREHGTDEVSVTSPESAANLAWWDFFHDPELQNLIRIALDKNKDRAVAAARVDESRALLGFTRADQFPRLDLVGDASRTDPSDTSIDFALEPRNNFGLLGALSFELDFWGRVRNATEAQRAELFASEYSLRTVTIALVAQVASAYFTIEALHQRLAITKRTLENRTNATGIIRARFEKGIVPELDVNQAEIEEYDAAVAQATFERDLVQAENALNVLLGRLPAPIQRGTAIDLSNFAKQIPLSYPADLLERRPDVLSSEELVKAQLARVGVARAEQLPILDLVGFVGLRSTRFSNLDKGDSFTWSIGGNLIGPLIDFGKSSAAVDVQVARSTQAYRTYEQTVLRAVQEVEDSLVATRTYDVQYAARTNQVKSASNASRLARARYDDGISSYLEVLDVDRSLFEAELGASNSQQQYLISIVQLYKALGGGWTEEEEPKPAAPQP